MGWQSINAAFATVRATRDVTLAAASLLVALAYHRNDMTGECFPSYDTLMSETRMALKTLRSALRLLEELGLVSYVRERVGAKTIYTLHIDTVQKDTVQKDTGKGAVLPGYREQICPPNREINKELNKENPLPPPSPLARRKTHLFDLEELPPEWKTYCEEVRPDLDPDKVFTDFSFYWSSGRGSGTRRSDKGWAASWQTWVRREKEAQRREGGQRRGEEFHPGDLDTTGFRDMFR